MYDIDPNLDGGFELEPTSFQKWGILYSFKINIEEFYINISSL